MSDIRKELAAAKHDCDELASEVYAILRRQGITPDSGTMFAFGRMMSHHKARIESIEGTVAHQEFEKCLTV